MSKIRGSNKIKLIPKGDNGREILLQEYVVLYGLLSKALIL